ncbi:MAG: hypothetical protein ABIC91_08510 [Nanoarchaeota archaeon]|nr:hypothetical protein [Nanoarchaeota archaeon]MBU1030322.1 hypothetical protein [Nanoarchaeota archaeon]MBU1849099.1 hypothetical protein [Nanoarchaeota archaeon]
MLKVYKKRLITGLLTLMGLFFCLFLLAIIDLNRGRATIQTGLPQAVENWGLIIISIFAMIKVLREIIKIEH